MKMSAQMMITVNRKLYKPGEEFEVEKSQALILLQNGFAVEVKATPAKKNDSKKEDKTPPAESNDKDTKKK